ncbi:MAG: 3-methyl-2-oxobutanoate dehydrogenase subunit beta, partial [Eggerthellaceae bacterium]|nr:3-methyl-2-oxobutanoate dehydrogenase subunit beta [Eggerthellaceae bacterium]
KGLRPHNIANSLYLTPEDLDRLNHERFARYEVIKATEQQAELLETEDAEIVVVAYGASARISRSAVYQAREAGMKVGLIRPKTLWPYPVDAILSTIGTAKAYLTVEMNMGQMVDDVRLAVNGAAPVEFFGHAGGIIPTPDEVFAKISQMYGKAGE